LHPAPAPTSSCVPRTYWPHGMPESAPRDANSATKLSLARESAVPQRSTATPPPRPAIKPGWVPPARAQPPISLRLREVRDEGSTGQLPLPSPLLLCRCLCDWRVFVAGLRCRVVSVPCPCLVRNCRNWL
jgi:hypothetical protein